MCTDAPDGVLVICNFSAKAEKGLRLQAITATSESREQYFKRGGGGDTKRFNTYVIV